MALTPLQVYNNQLLAAKKKPPTKPVATVTAPKPVRSVDPYGALLAATPQQIAAERFRLSAAGPNYSGIKSPDFASMQASALAQADERAQRLGAPITDERQFQLARQQVSNDAAKNFAAAFASILGGGNANIDDPAAQKYSLENFGGSYLGGMAARMGQQLMMQAGDTFSDIDHKLASKLADIMDARPDEAEKIYEGLVSQAQELVKEQKTFADAEYKTQIAALAALESSKRKDAGGADGVPKVKNFSDGTTRQYNPKTGKWDVVTSKAGQVSTVTQGGGAVVGYDPQTGRIIYKIPGSGGKMSTATGGSGTINKTSAGKPISFSAAGEYARSMTANTETLWKVRKVKGGGYEAYDTGKAKAGGSDSTATGTAPNGGKIYAEGSAYAVLNGLSQAKQSTQIFKWRQKAQESALFAKDPANESSYQEALKGMTVNLNIPLDIAQKALNRYWKRGERKKWEDPGQGRPQKSWQELHPKDEAAVNAAAPSQPRSGYSVAGHVDLNGVSPTIINTAKHFGLSITSGFRSVAKQAALYANRSASGSVGAPGKSNHNYGKAVDVSPNANAMAFLAFAFANPHLFREVFYDPAGKSIKNGKIVNYTIGGHSDHVHFAQ